MGPSPIPIWSSGKLASKREREFLKSERLGSCLNGLSRPTLLFRERERERESWKLCVFLCGWVWVWVGIGIWRGEERGGFEISLWDGKVIKVSGWERKCGVGCLEDWELGEGLGNQNVV